MNIPPYSLQNKFMVSVPLAHGNGVTSKGNERNLCDEYDFLQHRLHLSKRRILQLKFYSGNKQYRCMRLSLLQKGGTDTSKTGK